MKYNFVEIGNRLRKMRKESGLSQEKLAEILDAKYGIHTTRQNISTIENAEKNERTLTLDMLTALADFFNCEIGYLLCEYDCKTRCAVDICDATGLSPLSAETLLEIKENDKHEKEENRLKADILGYKTKNNMTTLDIFDAMLKTGELENIILSFKKYISKQYNIPVVENNGKLETVDYKHPLWNVIPRKHYSLLLAKKENEPLDFVEVPIDDTFLETVALKEVEKEFQNIRDYLIE